MMRFNLSVGLSLALTACGGQFEAPQSTASLERNGEEAFDLFLRDHREERATELGGLSVDWNDTDTPRAIYGDAMAIRPSDVGCRERTNEGNMRCLVDAHRDLFMIESRDLELIRERSFGAGGRVLRFQQQLWRVPIVGAHLVTALDRKSKVLGLTSSTIPEPLATVSEGDVDRADPPLPLSVRTNDLIAREIGAGFGIIGPEELAFHSDLGERLVPVWSIPVGHGDGLQWTARIDLDGDLIDVLEDFGAAPQVEVYVDTARFETSSSVCLDDGDCSGGVPMCMTDPANDIDTCALGCLDDNECVSAYGSGWICLDDGDRAGWCDNYDTLGSAPPLDVYTTAAGMDSAFADEASFLNAAAMGEGWNTYLNVGLGFEGWDDQGSPFKVYLGSPVEAENKASAYGGGGNMTIYALGLVDDKNTVPLVVSRDHLVGHEGGHTLFHEITGSMLSYDQCMQESLVQVHGGFYARWQSGDITWTPPFSGRQSAWQDGTGGLDYPGAGGFDALPGSVPSWSQRSRYDWMPCPEEGPAITFTGDVCTSSAQCPPYYSCRDLDGDPDTAGSECAATTSAYYNRSIWLRLARVLSTGTDDLYDDGNHETQGISAPGLGDDLTREIFFDAFELLLATDGPLDFARNLRIAAAAQSPSQLVPMRYALGSTGFPGATFAFDGVVSDRAPRAVKWWGWPYSWRDAYVYKEQGGDDVIVRIFDGANLANESLGANTDDAPTAIAHNDLLHVFWRDQATEAIHMAVLEHGVPTVSYDLGGIGLFAGGPFDAAVVDGDLVLGFVAPGDNTLSLARCTVAAGGCSDTPNDWHYYARDSHIVDLGLTTGHGVGLATTAGMNGAGADEALYALLTELDGSLYVARMDGNTVTGAWGVPSTHPSHRADPDLPRSLVVRPSAFPSAGDYLYAAWNDVNSDAIMTSVLQDWSNGFFTRSIGIGETSNQGVSYWRHDATISARPAFVADTGHARYNVVWGRY